MKLSVGVKLLQIILVVTTFIVLISGLLALGLGSYIFARLSGTDGLTEVHTIPLFLIIAGILIFLIALPGFIGAMCKMAFLLRAFSILLIFFIIVQLAAGICVIVYKDRIDQHVTKFMQDSIKKYRKTSSETLLWSIKRIQISFNCCGGVGPVDWNGEASKYCCKSGENCGNSSFTIGCGPAIYDALQENTITIGIVLAIFCLIEVIAVVSGFILARKVSGSS
nr:tetraspanin [Hymenolepis microstoma]